MQSVICFSSKNPQDFPTEARASSSLSVLLYASRRSANNLEASFAVSTTSKPLLTDISSTETGFLPVTTVGVRADVGVAGVTVALPPVSSRVPTEWPRACLFPLHSLTDELRFEPIEFLLGGAPPEAMHEDLDPAVNALESQAGATVAERLGSLGCIRSEAPATPGGDARREEETYPL